MLGRMTRRSQHLELPAPEVETLPVTHRAMGPLGIRCSGHEGRGSVVRQRTGAGDEIGVEVRLRDEQRAPAVAPQFLDRGDVRLDVAFGIDHDDVAIE